MKILFEEGCTNSILSIDGKDFFELSYDELKKTAHKIINIAPEQDLYEFINSFVLFRGEMFNEDYCEECGTPTADYKIEIKD